MPMLPIYHVLKPDHLEHLRAELERILFVDGRSSAGAVARKVKANLQAESGPQTEALESYVRDLLMGSPEFRLYARPVRWSRILFSRYRDGQHYGRHYDNWEKPAQGGGSMRSDLSFTLFLTEPEYYGGGELTLERPEGALSVKLPAGAVFVYPTEWLHQVLPVISGERVVGVGWVQSAVRRDDQRRLLFDLEKVLGALPEGDPRLLLDKSIGTLLRLWAEI
jgi:PKHD-type hydroxylase